MWNNLNTISCCVSPAADLTALAEDLKSILWSKLLWLPTREYLISRWWGSTTVTNWNFGISKFYRSLKIDAAAGCINLTYQKTLRSDIHYPAHQREMKARIHKYYCMHRNFVTKLSIFLFLSRFDMTHLAYNSFKFRITFIMETSCFKDNLPIIQQGKRKSEVVPVLVSISISAVAAARSSSKIWLNWKRISSHVKLQCNTKGKSPVPTNRVKIPKYLVWQLHCC